LSPYASLEDECTICTKDAERLGMWGYTPVRIIGVLVHFMALGLTPAWAKVHQTWRRPAAGACPPFCKISATYNYYISWFV